MAVKKEGLTNNFIFQFLYQIIILFIPLIISPFLTRRLGDHALGTYSYINSIAYYFIVFANLGISKHGQRLIANASNDEIALRKAFWSLYFLHFCVSFVSSAAYLAFVFLLAGDNINIYLIECIYVVSAIFDITWLFYGLENFKSVVIKNLVIRIAEFILILVFVKKPSDLWVYTLISATAILLGQMVMLPQAIKHISPIRFYAEDIKQHIKPLLVFSVAVIATSLYTVLDKTLLGLMVNKENVAYYEYANKIISLPRTFIIIIGTVIFPRSCVMVQQGDFKKQSQYLNISLIIVCFIGLSSLFGIMAVGEQLAFVYYGEEFVDSGKAMVAMCSLPLIIGLGEIVRSQFLIPNKLDKEYTACIVLNAVVNIILSLIFIPKLGIYGAIIGTLGAELFGCVFQIIICRKYFNPLVILKKLIPFTIIGLLMYLIIFLEGKALNYGTISLIIKIATGATAFLLLSCVYVFIFEKDFWRILVTKMHFLMKKNKKEVIE